MQAVAVKKAEGNAVFKFEGFVLHVQCADLSFSSRMVRFLHTSCAILLSRPCGHPSVSEANLILLSSWLRLWHQASVTQVLP